MNVSYQIRTVRNTPVYIFDSLLRAKEEMQAIQQRIGCKMKLVKVVTTEEVIHD